MVWSHSFGEFLRRANESGFFGFLLPIGPTGANSPRSIGARSTSQSCEGRPVGCTRQLSTWSHHQALASPRWRALEAKGKAACHHTVPGNVQGVLSSLSSARLQCHTAVQLYSYSCTGTVDSQTLVVWICRAKSAPNFGRRESLIYISSDA